MAHRVVMMAVLATVLAGCGGGLGASCRVDDDCRRELACACRGTATDPCTQGMSPEQCQAARCGSRECIHPAEPPGRR
jgi:hypothetical protein